MRDVLLLKDTGWLADAFQRNSGLTTMLTGIAGLRIRGPMPLKDAAAMRPEDAEGYRAAIYLNTSPFTVIDLCSVPLPLRRRMCVLTLAQDVVMLAAIEATYVSNVLPLTEHGERRGGAALARDVLTAIGAASAQRRDGTMREATGATRSELSIVRMLLAGKTTEEIAVCLNVSPKTVNAHVSNLLRASSAPSRLELVRRLTADYF